MSKKALFKQKVVTLQLPNCPPVYFNPSKCEWTQDQQSFNTKQMAQQLDEISKSQLQLEKEIANKHSVLQKMKSALTTKTKQIQNQRRKLNQFKIAFMNIEKLKNQVDAQYKKYYG